MTDVERSARLQTEIADWLATAMNSTAMTWDGKPAIPIALMKEALATITALEKLKHEVFDNPELWMKWCDHRVLERAEADAAALTVARARITQLEQEKYTAPCRKCDRCGKPITGEVVSVPFGYVHNECAE